MKWVSGFGADSAFAFDANLRVGLAGVAQPHGRKQRIC